MIPHVRRNKTDSDALAVVFEFVSVQIDGRVDRAPTKFHMKTARAFPLGLRSLIEGDLSFCVLSHVYPAQASSVIGFLALELMVVTFETIVFTGFVQFL